MDDGTFIFFNENLSPSADQPDDLLISYMIDVIGVDFWVLLRNFFFSIFTEEYCQYGLCIFQHNSPCFLFSSTCRSFIKSSETHVIA